MTPKFKYEKALKHAINEFWRTRDTQYKKQKAGKVRDYGSRGAVTGGKQMDGFAELLRKISIDSGVPDEWIYTGRTDLPGYFRPTKKWDFIIVTPNQQLITCLEFKSQVGSFGNNFNNRSEEAIGNAVDCWTAFRKRVFPFQQPPWLGYLIVVEESEDSISAVEVMEPHFKCLPEYQEASYIDRYRILCEKLMLERLYNFTSLISTQYNKGNPIYNYPSNELSFERFVSGNIGYLMGRKKDFSK